MAVQQDAPDISRVLVRDPGRVGEVLEGAVRRGAVGPVPGGGTDPAAGKAFIARKTGIEPQEVTLRPVSLGSRQEARQGFEPVRPVFEAPASYREIGDQVRRKLGGTERGSPGVSVSLRESIARTTEVAVSRPDRGIAPTPIQVGEGREVLRQWVPRDLRGGVGGAERPDLRREAAPETYRPGREEIGRPGLDRRGQLQPTSPSESFRDGPRQERLSPEVREPVRSLTDDVSPSWRPSPRPDASREVLREEGPRPSDVRREVPRETAPRPSDVRREVPREAMPRPSDVRREVPRETAPRPSDVRREVPRETAPRPSDVRREVPDRSPDPGRSLGPSFRSVPAPSSGSQSVPPPSYVPPRPRDSGRAAPGRPGPFRR